MEGRPAGPRRPAVAVSAAGVAESTGGLGYHSSPRDDTTSVITLMLPTGCTGVRTGCSLLITRVRQNVSAACHDHGRSPHRRDGGKVPLTSQRPDGTVLDATDVSDEVWRSVHRAAESRRTLRCRECQAFMHAKVSSKGLRFFAHDSRPVDCSSEGESPEHRELKRRVAEAIRAAGGQALIEAPPSPSDRGGWRADVLAVGLDGRRVAFEVQLAGMSVDEGAFRTERYAADNIATVWVTTKHAHWMSCLPSMRLLDEGGGRLVADRGLARLHAGGHPRWLPAGTVDAVGAIRGLLDGRVTTTRASYFAEQVGDRHYDMADATLLVSVADKREFAVLLAEAESRRRAEFEAEQQHARRLQELAERQERVLQRVLHEAVADGIPDHRLWLGIRATWWNGRFPVPLREAAGNDKTAMGAVIWTGPAANDIAVWAVICPVASRTSPSLGRSWRRRGVRVYVETESEAARVARALEWTRAEVMLAGHDRESG